MRMNLLLRLVRTFARRRTSLPDFKQFQAYKAKLFEKLVATKDAQDIFIHEDRLYEEELYGRKLHITGVTESNFSSTEFQRQAVSHLKPQLIILGGLNDTAISFQDLRAKFSKDPIHRPEQMYCKQRMIDFLQKLLQTDQYSYFDDKYRIFLQYIPLEKRVICNPYFSCAYETVFREDCKLAFGKPSDILIFEDIMLRIPLNELREMFSRTVEKVKEKHPNDSNFHSSFIQEAMHNYAMACEPALFSREVVYLTALLNTYAKIDKRVLLIAPGSFTQRIAENVHKITVNPGEIFRVEDPHSENASLLSAILSEKPIKELLEKFAILNFLKQNRIQGQFLGGTNVFAETIFAPLFKDIPMEDLLPFYCSIRNRYSTRFRDLIRSRIENILVSPRRTCLMDLSEQFATLDKRNEAFPLTFTPKNYNSVLEENLGVERLSKKMKQILFLEGTDREKRLYDEITHGQPTRDSIIVYSKLMGKANVQLKERVKLPVHHYGAFRGIYKQYMRDHILGLDVNPEMAKFDKQFDGIKQKIEATAKEIKDPQLIRKYLNGQMGPCKQLNIDPRNLSIDSMNEQVVKLNELFEALAKQEEQNGKTPDGGQ